MQQDPASKSSAPFAWRDAGMFEAYRCVIISNISVPSLVIDGTFLSEFEVE